MSKQPAQLKPEYKVWIRRSREIAGCGPAILTESEERHLFVRVKPAHGAGSPFERSPTTEDLGLFLRGLCEQERTEIDEYARPEGEPAPNTPNADAVLRALRIVQHRASEFFRWKGSGESSNQNRLDELERALAQVPSGTDASGKDPSLDLIKRLTAELQEARHRLRFGPWGPVTPDVTHVRFTTPDGATRKFVSAETLDPDVTSVSSDLERLQQRINNLARAIDQMAMPAWRPPTDGGAQPVADSREPGAMGDDCSVVLPDYVRESLGIVPGESVYFVKDCGHGFRIVSSAKMKEALGDGPSE